LAAVVNHNGLQTLEGDLTIIQLADAVLWRDQTRSDVRFVQRPVPPGRRPGGLPLSTRNASWPASRKKEPQPRSGGPDLPQGGQASPPPPTASSAPANHGTRHPGLVTISLVNLRQLTLAARKNQM